MPRGGESSSRRLRPYLDPGAAQEALVQIGSDPAADAHERFATATERPPEEWACRGDAGIVGRLGSAPVLRMGRIPYASNAVFLLELEGSDPSVADQPLRAVYKPDRGERPLWDFPRHTLHLREMASYLVNVALGFDHIPPTVLREGPLGPGSVQLFVHSLQETPTPAARRSIDAQLWKVAALDALINNADRKRAHLIVAAPRHVYGIDNALTFLPYPRQRTVLVDLGGSPLPAGAARAVSRLAGDPERRSTLRTRLSLLLADAEVSAFDHRLDELAADPVYPLLDPWDGRPFEWF